MGTYFKTIIINRQIKLTNMFYDFWGMAVQVYKFLNVFPNKPKKVTWPNTLKDLWSHTNPLVQTGCSKMSHRNSQFLTVL